MYCKYFACHNFVYVNAVYAITCMYVEMYVEVCTVERRTCESIVANTEKKH